MITEIIIISYTNANIVLICKKHAYYYCFYQLLFTHYNYNISISIVNKQFFLIITIMLQNWIQIHYIIWPKVTRLTNLESIRFL